MFPPAGVGFGAKPQQRGFLMLGYRPKLPVGTGACRSIVRSRASLQILDVKGRNHWGDSDAYG